MQVKGRQNKKSHDGLFMSLQMVFGLIGGVLIAALWLALKPVTILDAPPATAEAKTDRHEVQYVRGRPAGRGTQGARKQKAFFDRTPGTLVFAEEDVNRWLGSVYDSKERTIRVEGIDLTLGPRVPSVRLVNDEMEIGLEIGMDRAGGVRTLVAQARGRFVSQGGQQVFVPRQIYVGSCPLPWNLGGRMVYEKLKALYPISDYVQGAWSALDTATIEKGRLQLVVAGAAAPEAAPIESSVPAVTVPEVPATENPVTTDQSAPAPVDPQPAVEAVAAPVDEVPAAPVDAPVSAPPTAETPAP